MSEIDATPRRAWVALAVLACPTILVSMDMTILHLITPTLSAELRPSGAQLLWISDIYALMVASALVPMGSLGDRIGRRRLLLAGALGFSIASVFAAAAQSASQLIAARALLGVAGATLLPSTLALIREIFPGDRTRSIAIGIWTACFTLGAMLGPMMGGFLLTYFHWGAAFLMGLPLMIALLVLGGFFLPETQRCETAAFDVISLGQFVASVLLLTYAIKTFAQANLFEALAALVIGGATCVAFAIRQYRSSSRLLDLRLFCNSTFSTALLANAVSLFAWVGTSLLIAQHLQLVLGLSPLRAGLWTLPAAGACALTCLAAPLLAKRCYPARLVAGGLTTTAAGLFLLAALSGALGLPAIVVAYAVLGVGVSLVVTLSTHLIISAAPPEKAGAASAVSETAAEMGGALGVAVLGSLAYALYRHPLAATSNDWQSQAGTLGELVALLERSSGASAESLLTSARMASTHGTFTTLFVAGIMMSATAVLFWRRQFRRQSNGLEQKW